MQLYLNNDGSRWIDTESTAMNFVLVTKDSNGKETRKLRKADYYFSFGNFAGLSYRIAGKRYSALPKACDGSETGLGNETGLDLLPHVFHEYEFNELPFMKGKSK